MVCFRYAVRLEWRVLAFVIVYSHPQPDLGIFILRRNDFKNPNNALPFSQVRRPFRIDPDFENAMKDELH